VETTARGRTTGTTPSHANQQAARTFFGAICGNALLICKEVEKKKKKWKKEKKRGQRGALLV
jgi:hypothetical protein